MKLEAMAMAMADLPVERRELVATAIAASRNAYAPYSKFRVGAALLFSDGLLQAGANFENVSYGLSLCAETVALASASAAGRLGELVAMAVAAEGHLDAARIGDFVTPCGRCRQVLAEAAMICGHEVEVWLVSRDSQRVCRTTSSALLPGAFGS